MSKTNDLSKKLPTIEISKLSMANGIRNMSKSSEISMINNTNERIKIS